MLFILLLYPRILSRVPGDRKHVTGVFESGEVEGEGLCVTFLARLSPLLPFLQFEFQRQMAVKTQTRRKRRSYRKVLGGRIKIIPFP